MAILVGFGAWVLSSLVISPMVGTFLHGICADPASFD
jgi:hypothetical protein